MYCNLWLAVCWILFILRHEFQNSLDRIGMRGMYINAVLMSLAYVVPLAIFPVYVFGKNIQPADDTESVESTPKKTKDYRLDDVHLEDGTSTLK